MLLIDTSNVLHVTGVLPTHLAGLDVPGLARLISTSRYSQRRAVLVSDGVGPRTTSGGSSESDSGSEAFKPVNTAPSGREIAGLDLVYAGADREADDVIELLIARDSAPRRLLVVSTDRRLVRAARRRRARSLTSEDFLRQIAGDSERKPKPELPGFAAQVPLNSYAVGYWMALFGYSDAPGEERTPGTGPVADISEAARRGLDDDRARKRARGPHAHEGLKIPKDLLSADGKASLPPPLPAGEVPRAAEAEGGFDRQLQTPADGEDAAASPAGSGGGDDLPNDIADLLKDSGLTIDPADLDMTRWLPKDDNSPPSS